MERTFDGLAVIAERNSFTGTFLVIDVRGWSEIVHALGPDPRLAAEIIECFWDQTQPVIEASGGEVYAWRGDGLLVAYRGARRMDKALRAAERVLEVVRTKLAPRFWPLLRAANAGAQFTTDVRAGRTLQFAVAAAVTDGKAIPVPVRFGAQQSEELTGDWVNVAFDLVKWVAPETVGVSGEVSDWLIRTRSTSLNAFTWDDEHVVPLAGAVRRVRTGIPGSKPAIGETGSVHTDAGGGCRNTG